MKINFLTPHLRIAGGVRILLMYASLLAQRGHDVHIYVRSTNRFRRTVANLLQIGGPDWIKDLHGAKVIRVDQFSEDTLCDADILVSTTFDNTLQAERFSERKGKKVYLLQHDEGLYHGDRNKADEAYRVKSTKVVVSSWLRDVLQDRAQTDGTLLLNPIDHHQFFEVPGLRNTDGEIRVLLLVHTYDWKGTAEGIEIVQRLKKRYPNLRLDLFGVRQKDGVEILGDTYTFNPPQETLRNIYSRADIYLCPSWDEGFGLPSVEAMKCGAALVTYDNGGSRDFALHEETALVARRRDTQDLERQLERLITDEKLRVSLAKKGQQFVSNMPGWEERTIEFESILEDIVNPTKHTSK